MLRSRRHDPRLLPATAILIVLAVAALLGEIGADARWVAALGHDVVRQGSLPRGIPFAPGASASWPNPLVLAELLFDAAVQALGLRGLVVAQLLAVTGAMWALARDARAGGAGEGGIAAAIALVALGALPSLAISRVQLFSLVLFGVLVALLRSQARAPSRGLWLVVPLLALWANLHGGVLLGLLVVLAYLALRVLPRRPRLAAALAPCAAGAVCLTPALWRTVDYYHGLLANLAAQRGEGMWGPFSLASPVDLVLLGCAAWLAVRFVRARPAAWELAVALGLAALTLGAQRNGVWLLLFLAPVAARELRPRRTWDAALPAAALASAGLLAFALARGPWGDAASPAVIARALALARGTPLLAERGMDEQVVLAGGRIALGEPIDAFSRRRQAAYLDFLDGAPTGRGALGGGVRVVLVQRGSPAARLVARTPGFAAAGGDRAVAIYARAS